MTSHWKTLIGKEGYIRVGQDTRGTWWFLDPRDTPFYAKAVAGVNRAGTQGGRLATDGPYAPTVDRKYHYPDSPDAFVKHTHHRLREWGFNSHGAWITEEFFDRGLLYTDILECRKQQPPTEQLNLPGCKLPDVFAPGFAEGVERICARLCPPRRDKKDMIGYFTDNELGWAAGPTDHVWGGGASLNIKRPAPTLLQICLGLEPGRPAREEAWRFVNQRHPRPADLAAAWNLPSADPATFQKMLQNGVMIDHPVYGKDLHDFVVHFALAYFRVTGEAIRRHDPHHLILGCRFGSPPGDAVGEAVRQSPWIDVVSANNYRDTMRERIDEYTRVMRKPVFIGEYAWASDYHTRITDRDTHPRWPALPLAARTAVKGRAALEEAFAHPMVVGYTWYRWIQNPRPDAQFPLQGYGLVDEADEPNPFNVDLLAALNPRAEAIHAGKTPPATHDDLLNALPPPPENDV